MDHASNDNDLPEETFSLSDFLFPDDFSDVMLAGNCPINFSLLTTPSEEVEEEDCLAIIRNGFYMPEENDNPQVTPEEALRMLQQCPEVDLNEIRPILSQRATKKQRRECSRRTLKNWFDMPRQENPDIQTNMKVLSLKQATDPKFLYKTDGHTELQYFDFGKVITHPTEYYTAQETIAAPSKKKLLVDQLLEDSQFMRSHKKRLAEAMQQSKTKEAQRRNVRKYKQYQSLSKHKTRQKKQYLD